jgi:hypothetical protein
MNPETIRTAHVFWHANLLKMPRMAWRARVSGAV